MTIIGQHRLMESPPGVPFSGGSLWKRLLITAFFLSCWIHPTSAQGAQLTVVPNPPYGTVGSSVILDIMGFSEQAFRYIWYRKAIRNRNLIAFYDVGNGVQRPANIQEKVFSNGSLLIPDLTLSDTDDYLVLINSRKRRIMAQGHLAVYAEKSLGVSNGSSLSGGAITGIVFGILIGVTLFGVLIYFHFFRDRAIKYQLSEKNHSARKHGEDITLYENIVLQGSLLPEQDLGSSPAFPEVPLESFYQTLDITRVDVYDKIYPWKKPKA